MELRDLLLVLIPIIANGVLLFVFQQFLTWRISSQRQSDEMLKSFFKEYSTQIEIVLGKLDDLKKVESELYYEKQDLINKVGFEQFSEKMNLTHEAIYKLISYCELYEPIIDGNKHLRKKRKSSK